LFDFYVLDFVILMIEIYIRLSRPRVRTEIIGPQFCARKAAATVRYERTRL